MLAGVGSWPDSKSEEVRWSCKELKLCQHQIAIGKFREKYFKGASNLAKFSKVLEHASVP